MNITPRFTSKTLNARDSTDKREKRTYRIVPASAKSMRCKLAFALGGGEVLTRCHSTNRKQFACPCHMLRRPMPFPGTASQCK
eukprot:4644776-Pleurochrysis_carterae.AAC.1